LSTKSFALLLLRLNELELRGRISIQSNW